MATFSSTYQWDTASSADVAWFLCWSYSDDGAELISKVLRKIRPKGKFTDATISVYSVTADSVIDVDDLTSGASPLYSYSLDDSTLRTQYPVQKTKCKNMLMYTIRISGVSNWDGTGLRDTLEEIALLLDVAGQER